MSVERRGPDPSGLHVIRSGPDGDPAAAGDQGLPVVIVHGGMDRASSFGRMARNLADLPLVRYDRRGYGRSIGAGVAPVSEHVRDLLAIIGHEPAVVFGHSMGAVIALIAAEQRPDLVRSVVAYEAPLPWAEWWPTPSGAAAGPSDPADDAERFMRRMVGDHIWERLPARTRADRRAEGEALRADLRSLANGRPLFDPAAIAAPVCSAAGSETTWWHRRAAEELAAALPAGELVVVEGASHGVHLTRPAVAADLVRHARERARIGEPGR